MPYPVVTHLVLTAALIGAMLIMLAVYSHILFVQQMQNMNLALSEVAESAAREVVELVSVSTLGGGSYSYMAMTLPSTLAGQPYELQLSEEGENVLKVVARLQIYQQVRVVVTPNFGKEPVHVVGAANCAQPVEIPGLGTPSSSIRLPLPSGRPVIVAYRYGGSVCVGFAVMPQG
jgi:hypothetical protein